MPSTDAAVRRSTGRMGYGPLLTTITLGLLCIAIRWWLRTHISFNPAWFTVINWMPIVLYTLFGIAVALGQHMYLDRTIRRDRCYAPMDEIEPGILIYEVEEAYPGEKQWARDRDPRKALFLGEMVGFLIVACMPGVIAIFVGVFYYNFEFFYAFQLFEPLNTIPSPQPWLVATIIILVAVQTLVVAPTAAVAHWTTSNRLFRERQQRPAPKAAGAVKLRG